MKRTLIFGNGRLQKKFLSDIRKDDYLIGVDRAAYWLLTQRITPHMAIGDFDSVTKKEFQVIQKSVKNIKKFSPKKNRTDMELAIRQTRGETLIFGWSGTRFDHMLATLNILEHQLLIDETNRIRLIGKGRTILEPSGYAYVSIVPVTETIQVKLQRFKYNLPKTTIRRRSTRTVSNELTGRPAVIELFAGKAWVIESRD